MGGDGRFDRDDPFAAILAEQPRARFEGNSARPFVQISGTGAQHGSRTRLDDEENARQQGEDLAKTSDGERPCCSKRTYRSGSRCSRSRMSRFSEDRLRAIVIVPATDHCRRASQFIFPECRANTDGDHH